jgi:Asp-tRNA(Asn)/Glu-tRNA(Gln) amidotransferase A subunit family amidase
VHLDRDAAMAAVDTAPQGPLHGITIGVKDIIDTAGMPTEYGSPIYAGHRPRADAAAVAMLRDAGAIIMGKTVTAELAWFTPGPTTNPHRRTHTPGGSSSGSAAAVAAGMVDLALGTQTAGSVIRPASFCGVFGLKPTFGSIPTAGVKQAAWSLDTVGLFALDIELMEKAFDVLTQRVARPHRRDEVQFALVRTEAWDALDDDCRDVVDTAAQAVDATERELVAAQRGLIHRQPVVQAYEGTRALAWERNFRIGELSPRLREILDWGAAVSDDDYERVMAQACEARMPSATAELFGPSDVILTPAAIGEAPLGLESTGDPLCTRLWTLLGYPTLSVPGPVGHTGMPIGVQLVARPRREAALFDAAQILVNAWST